ATDNNAYNPALYLSRAQAYLDLDFPDLASGDAYRAVLLTDYVRDYLEEGELTTSPPSPDDDDEREDAEEFRAATHAWKFITASSTPLETLEQSSLHLLAHSLHLVGCTEEATSYLRLALRRFPSSPHLTGLQAQVSAGVGGAGGKSRRFVYPWNHHEPDRFSKETLEYLNTQVVPASSKNIEVRVVSLPLLSDDGRDLGTTKQLGVFATEDIAPGEMCLCEESALTVVTDPVDGGLCEYCGQRYSHTTETFTCETCSDAEAEGIETIVPVWCSSHCRDSAMAKYHPAICTRPIAPLHRAAATNSPGKITKLTNTSQPGGSVYALLLLKTFAMALVQNLHPLELPETKYLYGVPPVELAGDLKIGWGWEENVRGAVGILEALGVDVFTGTHHLSTDACPEWWDTWVVNTLIAKFRGVASGRLDSRGQTEAAAAHTLYSLVNHDCEPNVRWECGGIMKFWGEGEGVRKGEELKSCYCDKRLGVKERREWMLGCLGGWCRCERCLRE
ncbi:hypothetical protein K440DRAFT_493062, partial [Wilcoxina mikolae CBS 423.85]